MDVNKGQENKGASGFVWGFSIDESYYANRVDRTAAPTLNVL
jgi:hypothetical protein